MPRSINLRRRAVIFVVAILSCADVGAEQTTPIAGNEIAKIESQLSAALEVTSSVRQKLALRRVVKAAAAVIEKNQSAPNRFEIMGVLYRTQQSLYKLDRSATNRRAILETCEQLVLAPDEYADIRVDADLLLSQAQVVRQGGDVKQRSAALRGLIERYLGTSVEKKVVRTVLLMAVEAGEPRLIDYLEELINERFADDPAMIAYKREKLPGRVFGTTLFANLRDTTGNEVRFPMDLFGTTTALFFWSNDENGQANIKEIAEVLKKRPPQDERRLVIFSVNLDELPDAGESILRRHGVDWRALHLPGGRDSLMYKAYARVDPKFVTVSPTGIASLFQTGGNMHGKGFERWIGSSSARAWVDSYYCSKLQSLSSAEFLIVDPLGDFDPAAPPELKVLRVDAAADKPLLQRTVASVPEKTIRKIQACFVPPPARYNTSYEEVTAGYRQAVQLCDQAIEAYPEAPDLWMVRNRRMVALMGLWKLRLDNQYLKQAAAEAEAALAADYPSGTDVIARLCLARQSHLRSDASAENKQSAFVIEQDEGQSNAPQLAAAALLAMEAGDREAYAEIRETLLNQYGDEPVLWPLTSFMLDRYHRYWLYQIPFVSGHIYGRREARGISRFAAEQSVRSFGLPLKTLEGEAIRFPSDTRDKWVVLRFTDPEQIGRLGNSPDPTVSSRPFDDVRVYEVVLDDDAETIRGELAKRRAPPFYDVLCVDDDVLERIDRKFGMLQDTRRQGTLVLRSDGSVALAASALTHRGMGRHGNILSSFFLREDENAVDRAIANNDLAEAKRLAFVYAPAANDAEANAKLANEHLRARAKVYMAMEEWELALKDIELVRGRLLEYAGLLGMRTAELSEIELFRERALEALGRSGSEP